MRGDRGERAVTPAETKLLEAQTQLVACASVDCPKFVRADCLRWLDEVQATLPTIVVRANDPSGNDVLVRVFEDAFALANGTRERPAIMSEELGLDEVRRDRGAVASTIPSASSDPDVGVALDGGDPAPTASSRPPTRPLCKSDRPHLPSRVLDVTVSAPTLGAEST